MIAREEEEVRFATSPNINTFIGGASPLTSSDVDQSKFSIPMDLFKSIGRENYVPL